MDHDAVIEACAIILRVKDTKFPIKRVRRVVADESNRDASEIEDYSVQKLKIFSCCIRTAHHKSTFIVQDRRHLERAIGDSFF